MLQLINNDLVPSKGQIQWVQQNLKIVLVEQETESYSSEEMMPLEHSLLEKWHVPTHDFSQLSGGEKLKVRLGKRSFTGCPSFTIRRADQSSR